MGANLVRRVFIVAALLLGAGLAEAQVGYWTPAAADPVTCNAGNIGAYYFNTTTARFRICDGVAWGNVSTAAGGGGESDFVTEVEVDFGASGDTTATTIVAGLADVTSTSKIVCAPTLFATADRDDGDEDALIEGLTITVSERVVGTGFTVRAHPEMGRATGKYKVHCFYR